ncbi:peptidase T [Lentilactobacillus buchneri]|uniref:Peptidase T n=1 Tax=Lentilactobacillus buchneri subsp. silagei CD034 TaxID=1071400 RepID=J9W5B1_LENBU|nr:peptidase T [Lentilactobacillus buchneri]MCC6100338.1 peptidase T [Lactobacillus sp.]AFS00200.1 peptidase T [Lentilactobacillus buchneri subsp. silagei CD034]MCT2900420.1 peptidase T [Lentilactobacillus buchneri]MCT3543109.1 peptidase T [Lentilactobacillus buchneri]MCT3544943.1 peptidase T [Lentilactobacillus buchneri]
MAKYAELIPNFLTFVKINTRSDPQSTSIPSSDRETRFLNQLKDRLTKMGLKDVHTNEQSAYVFATLPGNVDKSVPTVGFISHIDTADFNAENIQPQIVENYDGHSVIKLDEKGEYTLDPKVFPSLKKYAGQTLITTDGSTLLGADDKAGVAEIIAAITYLQAHPEVKHGDIKIAFGPDEEIGTGADHFDVKDFGADVAYTVDGGPLGDLNYETFNAADAKVVIKGTDVHPAEAKGIMVNAIQVGMDFHAALPDFDRPEKTQDREGFFHLYDFQGTVDHTEMGYIIRDHDRDRFEARKRLFKGIANQMNSDFGEDRVKVTIKDQYYNMGEIIKKDPTPVKIAEQAMKNVDVTPHVFPVRGGTDGSKISYMGLPTPNIFAGGENMHGRFEYVSEQTMEKAVDVVLEIAKLYAEK